jgi:hypothetical protein
MIAKNTKHEHIDIQIKDNLITINGEQASIKVDEENGLVTLDTHNNKVEMSTYMMFVLRYQQSDSARINESHIGLVEALYIQRQQNERLMQKWLEKCLTSQSRDKYICGWKDEDGLCKNETYTLAYTHHPEYPEFLIMLPTCHNHEQKLKQPENNVQEYPIREEG